MRHGKNRATAPQRLNKILNVLFFDNVQVVRELIYDKKIWILSQMWVRDEAVLSRRLAA